MWKTIFTTPISRRIPTPTPTVPISSVPFITAFTWSARTVRSGSAMVIRSPIAKPTERRMPIFLEAVSPWPMYWPIGVIAISAPRLKRPIPITSRKAPATNMRSSFGEMSTHGVMERTKTRRLTGITERRDSLNFSSMAFRMADFSRGLGFSIVYKDTKKLSNPHTRKGAPQTVF